MRLRVVLMGGSCCVASARKASAIRCGCEVIIDFHADVSITSVACLPAETGRAESADSATVSDQQRAVRQDIRVT